MKLVSMMKCSSTAQERFADRPARARSPVPRRSWCLGLLPVALGLFGASIVVAAPLRATPVVAPAAATQRVPGPDKTVATPLQQPAQNDALPDGESSLADTVDLATVESAAPAHGAGLPMARVLDEVLSAGFEVRLANIAVDAAKGDATAFAALANPVLSVTVGRALGYNPKVCSPDCSANQYQFTLSDQATISDVLFGKRRLRSEIGQLSERIAKLQRDDALRLVRLAAKRQFAALVYSQARLRLAVRVLQG